VVTAKIIFRDMAGNAKIIRDHVIVSVCHTFKRLCHMCHTLWHSIDRFASNLVDLCCFSSIFVILGGVFVVLGGDFVLCSAAVDCSVGRVM